MASKHVTALPGAYTKVDTGAATALYIQNVSSRLSVKAIYAASLPAVDAGGWFWLGPREGLSRDTAADDLYVRAASSENVLVAVAE